MTLRAAFILDSTRVHQELAAFTRLAVGLATEGVRVLLALDGDPRDDIDDRDAPTPTITIPTRVPFWIRERAVHSVLDTLTEVGMDELDVVVSVGPGSGAFASRLADQLDVPLVVEARSRSEVTAIDRNPRVTVVTATEGLRDLAAARVGEDRCTHLPIPVPRTMRSTSQPRGLGVILGPVGNATIWTALIDGMASGAEFPGGLQHLAIELSGRPIDGRIWSHLRRRNLLSRVTAFDDADRLRGLLAEAAVIITPDSDRPIRSIERQAMYGGAVPIGVADPHRTDLQPGIDAILLEGSNTRRAAAWHDAVESARRPGLAEACRSTSEESLVSMVAPRWARFLETIVHGDATPIDAGI
ncbi:MAG: hypothetical protein O3A31_02300 [Planctomycetota bacterium]|nr:hypothetical protein [Planctomycetota bacterium]